MINNEEKLHVYKYFFKWDRKSSFYQISIRADNTEKTTFVTSFGFYQFNILFIGLNNWSLTFQKVMNNFLKLSCQLFLIYPDDIVIFSK